MQAPPGGAKRCPNCGERLRAGERKVVLYIGIAGVIVLLLLVGLAVYVTPAGAPDEGQGQAPRKEAPAKKNPLD